MLGHSPDGLGRLGMLDAGGIFPLASRMGSDGPQPAQYGEGNVPARVPDEMVEAMRRDDVDGSGIFDNRKNINATQGIFAVKYGIPGYVARESGLGPSEVIDAQTDTAIEVFLPGFINHRPIHGQVQHRYPLTQGINTPRSELTADRIDFQRAIESQPTWNNPDAGAATRIAPTFVKPYNWGIGPRPGPGSQLQGLGWLVRRGVGEEPSTPAAMPGGDLWMWALGGVAAGAVLALAWGYHKGTG